MDSDTETDINNNLDLKKPTQTHKINKIKIQNKYRRHPLCKGRGVGGIYTEKIHERLIIP